MPAFTAPLPSALVTHGFLYHGCDGAALMVAPLFAAIPNALAVSCIVHVPALSAYREAVVVSPEEEELFANSFSASAKPSEMITKSMSPNGSP
jgi:hypothetical protein